MLALGVALPVARPATSTAATPAPIAASSRDEPDPSRNPDNGKVKLTVGSKNFTEQFILGEIYAQALEAAGYDVDTELNLGSETIALKALKDGEISGYPEYTSTALTSFFKCRAEGRPGRRPAGVR